jgi:hypothetical protein
MEHGEIKLAAIAIKQSRYRFLRGNILNLVLPAVNFEIMKLYALCPMLSALCLSVGYLPERFQLFHGGSRIDGFGSLHNPFGEIIAPPGSN